VIRACGGDDALRQEVESLLVFDEVGDRFLELPALPLFDDDPEPSAEITAGRRIGPYEVVREIGSGGGAAAVLDYRRRPVLAHPEPQAG